MYEDMMKDLKEKMQPVVEITEINKKAAEKLIALQTSCVTDLFNAGLGQVKAMSEIREPKAAIELQVKFFKDVEAKITDVAEQEIATLTEVRDQLSEIVEKSMSEITELPASYSYFQDFSKFMPTFFETEKAEPKKAPAKAAPRKAAAPATSAA
ncbi:MAG: phasin family protein [Oceanospirillaceae bacterium]|nr:phasin family protein [Oceanospirillaceae bacterium]